MYIWSLFYTSCSFKMMILFLSVFIEVCLRMFVCVNVSLVRNCSTLECVVREKSFTRDLSCFGFIEDRNFKIESKKIDCGCCFCCWICFSCSTISNCFYTYSKNWPSISVSMSYSTHNFPTTALDQSLTLQLIDFAIIFTF